MTLAEMIRRFRILAKDHAIPPHWSDEAVTDWLNDAQVQACIRGRLIRDDASPDICQIALQVGTHTYALHPALYEIISIWVAPASGERTRPLSLQSREWLNRVVPDWRRDTQPSCFAIQDDTTIRIVGRIDVGDVLEMECYRLPTCQMQSPTSQPEIHRAHHEHLIDWALHKAYSVPDADAFDPTRAKMAEEAFTTYFGVMPDSDLRRITREDVVHHNVAILP